MITTFLTTYLSKVALKSRASHFYKLCNMYYVKIACLMKVCPDFFHVVNVSNFEKTIKLHEYHLMPLNEWTLKIWHSEPLSMYRSAH